MVPGRRFAEMTKPRVASPMKLESHTRPGWAGPGRERGWKCGRELVAQADGPGRGGKIHRSKG